MNDEINFIEEKELENGDWEYTFEVSEEINQKFIEMYGTEDYSDLLSEDFNDFIRSEIEKKKKEEENEKV